MTAPPKWVRKGEPGHVEVTGEVGKLLRVNVYANDGGLLYADRLPRDVRTGGPKGYVLQGTPEAPKKPSKNHQWSGPTPVDGTKLGNRCAQCRMERQDYGGGYFMFRRPGGVWEALPRVPKCEAQP